LGGSDDLEKDLNHFKAKYQEVERENYHLSQKVREFQAQVQALTNE